MCKVRQLVIAAGGVGSRMSPELNPLRSKALMTFRGEPLIHYVISWAKEAGFDQFFVSVNEHNLGAIARVVDRLRINAELRQTAHCFAAVPSLFKDMLDDRFAVTCGHCPVPSSHWIRLLKAAQVHECVNTAYSNPANPTTNLRRILLKRRGLQEYYSSADLAFDVVPDDHVYTRNPYVVTKTIIDEVERDSFRRTAGYFIYEHWRRGGSMTSIPACMPVEFDHDSEWERTLRFLSEQRAAA